MVFDLSGSTPRLDSQFKLGGRVGAHQTYLVQIAESPDGSTFYLHYSEEYPGLTYSADGAEVVDLGEGWFRVKVHQRQFTDLPGSHPWDGISLQVGTDDSDPGVFYIDNIVGTPKGCGIASDDDNMNGIPDECVEDNPINSFRVSACRNRKITVKIDSSLPRNTRLNIANIDDGGAEQARMRIRPHGNGRVQFRHQADGLHTITILEYPENTVALECEAAMTFDDRRDLFARGEHGNHKRGSRNIR